MTTGIIFFIKSYKSPTSHFNHNEYLQFSFSNARFGSSAISWFITDAPPTYPKISISFTYFRLTASTETHQAKVILLYTMWKHFYN